MGQRRVTKKDGNWMPAIDGSLIKTQKGKIKKLTVSLAYAENRRKKKERGRVRTQKKVGGEKEAPGGKLISSRKKRGLKTSRERNGCLTKGGRKTGHQD